MESSSEKYEIYKKDFLSEHYAYEVDMHEYSYNKALESKESSNQDELNIALDDFAIHTRILLDFYTNYGDCPDDAKANDFLPESIDWMQLIQKENDNIIRLDTRNKVNKQLAHLSYARINFENKSWEVEKIFENILSITKLFIENIDNKYISQKLQTMKDSINKKLKGK